MDKKDLINYQKESLAQRQAELAKGKEEYEAYLQSEQHERDIWEQQQDLWEAKAKKEGWHYTRKPFIGALERQQIAEAEKKRQIAELEEKLKSLKAE